MPKLFKCSRCENDFKKEQLTFKQGYVLLTGVGKARNSEQEIIALMSLNAWRHICHVCLGVENRGIEMHTKESGGRVIQLNDKREWKRFCDEYPVIASKYGLGAGKCPLGQHSPFAKIDSSNSWFKHGNYKTYNTLKLFTEQTANVNDKKEDDTSDDDMEPLYDRSGSTTTTAEFETLVNYMHVKKFAQVHSKTTWFKEQNLPAYMKSKGHLFRSPESYDRLLGRVKKQGKKHFLFKKNAKLWNEYQTMMKQVKKISDRKYHAGIDKGISVLAVKDGMFEKDRRLQKTKKTGKKKSGKDIVSEKLNEHKENHKKKISFEEQRILNMEKQTEILGSIGKGLCMMSMMGLTSDDVWGDVTVFVTMDFEPESERQAVLNIMGANKVRFVSIWKVAMKGDAKVWTKDKKNILIKNTINQIKAERNRE